MLVKEYALKKEDQCAGQRKCVTVTVGIDIQELGKSQCEEAEQDIVEEQGAACEDEYQSSQQQGHVQAAVEGVGGGLGDQLLHEKAQVPQDKV